MEEYLQEQRHVYDFSAANKGSLTAADTTGSGIFSPSSTISSVTSQDMTDFLGEFRQAYASLKQRKEGYLNKEELGEVLYILDQEPTEEQLTEMFNEVDIERKGSVEVDDFLVFLNAKLREGVKLQASSSVNNPNMNSAPQHNSPQLPQDNSQRAATGSPSKGQSGRAAHNWAVEGAAAAVPPTHPLSQQQHPPSSASSCSSCSSEKGDFRLQGSPAVGRRKSSGKFSKGKKSPTMVLWWGFQDLADTL
eukprot:TRINITY_DN67923_c9_g1_i1.p1 TRINITY_DN67923_c9_g1~~TRINITY_DN67923_c9_g1_i1.p1  ORF type:complete len:249 (-),score=31.72 TRINITY_DN67923_c9_g1_i1:301-1047(-)